MNKKLKATLITLALILVMIGLVIISVIYPRIMGNVFLTSVGLLFGFWGIMGLWYAVYEELKD